MPAKDLRWLQQRRRCWYVVREIPRDVRHAFGDKRRLVRSLHTDNLTTAQARRYAVLDEWAKLFGTARAPKQAKDLITAALEWREHVRSESQTGWYEDQMVAMWDVETSAADIEDPERRDTFLAIATGMQTPIEPFIEPWLGEQDIEHRSKNDHLRSTKELLEWCTQQQLPPTVQALTRRVAGQYVTHLLSQNLDRAKTVAKRLWSLKRLWAWLEAKGHADENPWLRHEINRNGRSQREKVPERPFTEPELQKLFAGNPGKMMLDLMHLALLSGARIEELALIRIRDVDVTERTMSIQADPKTPASRRTVPVHSATWSTIEARLAGKGADDFLFQEMGPAPKPSRQRSNTAGSYFGRYLRRLGLEDMREGQRRSLTNFHSFRRTFVTLAERAGQPESTIKAVVGHKRAGMTFGLYSGGPSLEQRRACVEAVRLPT